MPWVSSTMLTVEGRFGFAKGGLYALDDLLDRLPAPFARDQDAGVEYQSHADVSRGLRLRTISSMSAANSASITGS